MGQEGEGRGGRITDRIFCHHGSLPHTWLIPQACPSPQLVVFRVRTRFPRSSAPCVSPVQCSFVIHHGGSGTFACCVRAGVPQCTLPFMFDQFFWAEKAEWLSVGSSPLKVCVCVCLYRRCCNAQRFVVLLRGLRKCMAFCRLFPSRPMFVLV